MTSPRPLPRPDAARPDATRAEGGRPEPLGRGLAALFGEAGARPMPSSRPPLSTQQTASSSAALGTPAGVETASAALARLAPNTLPASVLIACPFQPRRTFDEAPMQELVTSIRQHGVLQPLLVRPAAGQTGQYEIIAGERRWRAAQLAGVHQLPVIIRELTDQETLEIALVENIQRENLNPIEEAEGYRRLMDEFKYSQTKLAEIVGKSRTHITNLLRLLNLPASVQAAVTDGRLSMAHARAIVSAPKPLELALQVMAENLSVRETEALLAEAQGRSATGATLAAAARSAAARTPRDANLISLERELTRQLGLKVQLQPRGAGGTLVVHYTDLDQLDLVLAKLRRA